MKKLLKEILKLVRYHKKFGFQGIVFLLKKQYKQNQTFTFSHSEYSQPIFLRNNTSDIPTFMQVIFNQDYLMDYNFEPKVIFDCGANIGLGTVYFKNKFPDAKIISIEPEQSNFELLLKNTKEYSNVFCLKGGIWSKSTNLVIKDVGLGNWGFMIEEFDTSTKDSIKSYTIDDIMKQFDIDQIDILKIDIEGSEKELFESNYEEWLPKTKVLIVELHDRLRKGCSKSFYKALSNYDFSTTHRGENIYVFMN